jgi:hypothetical protein
MNMETKTLHEVPLVNQTYQLDRFSSKPGWMFATITGIEEAKFDEFNMEWNNLFALERRNMSFNT